MDIKFKMFFKKIFNLFIDEAKEWFECLLIKNTPGRMGKLLRRLYWSKKFYKCSFFSFFPNCIIMSAENISIGDRAIFMQDCKLYANNDGFIEIGERIGVNCNTQINAANKGKIIIGNDVLIGPNVVIRASNHNYSKKNIPINKQGHKGGVIVVEDDVWIGAGVIILPNVTIGKGSIIGAGAVVNKDIPAYSLSVGIPARVIKESCRS